MARTTRVIGKARWPAIVDESTWRAAADLLTDPSRRRGPLNARALLTGVALCAVCGATVHSGGAAVTQRTRVYRCRSMKHVARSAEPVEEVVEGAVIRRLTRPDAAALLADNTRPDVNELRERAVAIRTRLDTAAADYTDNLITRSQFLLMNERLKAQLADVEAELADAGRVDLLGPLVKADDVAAVWEALPASRKRAVIDLLMTVRLHPPGRGVRTLRPETVEIDWK